MQGLALPHPAHHGLRLLPSLRTAALTLCLLLAPLLMPAQAYALCFTIGNFNNSTLCWNPVNPIPDAFDIEHVVWNPTLGEYLAVGNGGAILASPDGLSWTPRDSGTVQRLFSGLWDATRNQYMVVGDGGLVLTSPDGVAWTDHVTNTRARLLDIAANADGTRYVIVGERGTVLSSTDAIDWTETIVLSLSRRPALYGIVWHNNRFVAVGSSTTIISSNNGTDWIEHEYVPLVPGQPEPQILRDVAVSNSGLFVAVGGNATVYISSNGVDWDPSQSISSHPEANLRAVVHAGNSFIAVGDHGTSNAPLVLTSQTGVAWSDTDSVSGGVATDTLKTIAHNGTSLVTAGDQTLLQSPDTNLAWEAVIPDPDLLPTLNDVMLADLQPPRYLAAGAAGAILSSPDGLTWSPEDSGTGATLNGLAAGLVNGDNGVVVVGDNGTIRFSNNGQDWAPANIDVSVPENLAAVAYGNNTFIAVGEGGRILTSEDGASWTAVNINGFPMNLHGIAYGEIGNTPRFVAVGASGAVLTSDNDGSNWQSENSGVTGTLRAVAWNADPDAPRFVAVGQTQGGSPTAAAIYSNDGSSWTSAGITAQDPQQPAPPPLLAVGWSGRQFLAASDGGTFLRSATGQGWTTVGNAPATAIPAIHALAWTGDRFLVAGEDGSLFGSGGVDLAVGVDTDVSISEDDDPSFANAGLDKTYRFTVSNIGNLDATGVQFSYTLPPEVSNLAPAVAPATWSCSLNGSAGLSCATGRLPAGANEAVIIEITMTMPSESDITITHQIEVTADPADARPANNVLTVDTRIGPRAAPGLPSPDTDFSSRGAFGAVDIPGLVLLALAVALARRFSRHTAITSARN